MIDIHSPLTVAGIIGPIDVCAHIIALDDIGAISIDSNTRTLKSVQDQAPNRAISSQNQQTVGTGTGTGAIQLDNRLVGKIGLSCSVNGDRVGNRG